MINNAEKNFPNESLPVSIDNTVPVDKKNAQDISYSLVLCYQKKGEQTESDAGYMRLIEEDSIKKILDNDDDSEEITKLREEFSGSLTLVDKALIQKKIYECFSDLFALFFDIKTKRENAEELNNMIKQKLQVLSEAKAIVIDEQVLSRNEASINHYMKLLEELLGEVKQETDRFNLFARANNIYVNALAVELVPHNFLQILEEKIKNTKRYIKNVQRDINISYSRYSFGFESQMKQIAYLEAAGAQ